MKVGWVAAGWLGPQPPANGAEKKPTDARRSRRAIAGGSRRRSAVPDCRRPGAPAATDPTPPPGGDRASRRSAAGDAAATLGPPDGSANRRAGPDPGRATALPSPQGHGGPAERDLPPKNGRSPGCGESPTSRLHHRGGGRRRRPTAGPRPGPGSTNGHPPYSPSGDARPGRPWRGPDNRAGGRPNRLEQALQRRRSAVG